MRLHSLFILLGLVFIQNAYGSSCRKIDNIDAYFSGVSSFVKKDVDQIRFDIKGLKSDISKKSLISWNCHYAEILYLVSIHDVDALDFSISLMQVNDIGYIYSNNLNILFYNSSWSPVFWDRVYLSDKSQKNSVKYFFKKYPQFYGGMDLQGYLSGI